MHGNFSCTWEQKARSVFVRGCLILAHRGTSWGSDLRTSSSVIRVGLSTGAAYTVKKYAVHAEDDPGAEGEGPKEVTGLLRQNNCEKNGIHFQFYVTRTICRKIWEPACMRVEHFHNFPGKSRTIDFYSQNLRSFISCFQCCTFVIPINFHAVWVKTNPKCVVFGTTNNRQKYPGSAPLILPFSGQVCEHTLISVKFALFHVGVLSKFIITVRN